MKSTIIHFTRHAQAEHNVAEDYTIRDAILTPLGRRQSLELHERTKGTFQRTAQLLVSSPLRRPMQTMLVGYSSLIDRLGGPEAVVLLTQLQEVNEHACDVGSDRKVLEADPEFSGLDFGGLEDGWTGKEGIYDPANVKERARNIRKWLRSREEKEIVVVAHGDILRVITDGEQSWKQWDNAEVRTYTFVSENDEEAELVLV